jgi:hypothetical protein
MRDKAEHKRSMRSIVAKSPGVRSSGDILEFCRGIQVEKGKW